MLVRNLKFLTNFTFLITTMYNNFFRLKSSTLWKHFSDSPISVRNFILFWLVFTFLTHQSENWFSGNAHVIVLIQQQFQCSSFRVNERALQTEGPSQRTDDDDPGTFLLMRNIPCIMMATPSVVLAECDWRCVTSLSPSFITFKHFQNPVGLSCSQRILLRILLTGLTVSSLLCKLKYFSQTFVLVLSVTLSIQSGFGSCPISCWTKNFWG